MRDDVPFNTLTCVHRYNARRQLDVYRFLRRELGATRLQFIPIVEPRDFETIAPERSAASRAPVVGAPETSPDHPASIVTPWSVDALDYGYFLSKVRGEWAERSKSASGTPSPSRYRRSVGAASSSRTAGRVPQGPSPAHPGWRTRAELPVPGSQALFRARRAAGEAHGCAPVEKHGLVGQRKQRDPGRCAQRPREIRN